MIPPGPSRHAHRAPLQPQTLLVAIQQFPDLVNRQGLVLLAENLLACSLPKEGPLIRVFTYPGGLGRIGGRAKERAFPGRKLSIGVGNFGVRLRTRRRFGAGESSCSEDSGEETLRASKAPGG